MPLSAGTRLGPYEILAPIGAGGMGEVYRARDTKLDRDVAIKVLPAALAQDPERLARFEREAKVLASLNHPNIAQIYGIEDRALIMELVDGATLQGPLPLETALDYARQIADALEAAHEKNIIHRDLKPANIMITPAGVVKVLDFGLAAVSQFSDPSNPASSPTLTISPTRAGMILGTAAYMSPEQARGKAVDKRADIWAFGVVLFEMLTGKPLFEGETVSDTLAQVLTKEPDWERVPTKVQRLLRKCLEKDPKGRLRDIGDAWGLLEEAEPAITAPSRSRLGMGIWIATTVAVLMAGVLGSGWWRATRPIDPPLKPLVRLDVDLGPSVSLTAPYGTAAVLSPDGTRLVYVSQGRLFTRRLDQPMASELAGTEGGYGPFFSPDGQWVAFFAQGKLKKISVEGGAAFDLCNLAVLQGGSWGEDGNIIVAIQDTSSALRSIPATGGEPVPVTELAAGEFFLPRWPQILPGGNTVLFTAAPGLNAFDSANIEVISFADHKRKTLVRGGTFGRYLPSGHLVYVNGGTLFAVPFDLDRLEVHGTPVPVLEQVAYSFQSGFAQLDFSRTGTVVYRTGGPLGGRVTVQWMDSTGKTQPLLAKPGFYLRPRLSPDGGRLAMDMRVGANQDIWVYDWKRSGMTRLTFDGSNQNQVWTPDGRYIIFGGKRGMFWTRSDGASKPQPLTRSSNVEYPYSVAPDGKRLAFHSATLGTGFDLWTVPLESDGGGLRAGKPEVFLQTPFDERYPVFSPDGRWLAYSSNESGSFQVYVRAFPDQGRRWQISNDGGLTPTWSRDGRELLFRTEDNRIMVANLTAKGDSFAADGPKAWSEQRIADVSPGVPSYDLAPDGKRIVALMPADAPESPQALSHVVFLENFFDELRRRVPVGR
ncbi:MAG: protein kinase [Bryobacteraceae bacterium]|jgi:serine/threonine-protein kinase